MNSRGPMRVTMRATMRAKNKFDSTSLLSLAVGALGVVGSIIAWLISSQSFFQAWLFAWFYWFSIAIGCLGFFMIYRLSGGEWGKSLERIMLSGGRTIEVLALLFLPIFAGLKELYQWTSEAWMKSDPKLIHKHAYLNIPFWCVRTAFYLFGLYALSWILTRLREEPVRRMSAGGFIFVFLVVTFASIDWIMSLEALWYSTIYGMMILAGQGICGLAFPLLVMYFLQKYTDWNPPLTDKVLKDQGSLQLTTCILWTYTAFAQWLVIWIGNTSETVTWYISRAGEHWSALAWVVVVGQFAIPFQLLLFQRFKTKAKNLAGLGLFLLLAHWLDLYWVVIPAFHPDSFTINWMVVPTTAAIGGIWLWYFLRQLRTLKKEVLERG